MHCLSEGKRVEVFFALMLRMNFNFLIKRRHKVTMEEMQRGQAVRIVRVEDDATRAQFIRFGIGEGSRVTCLEKIPFGPLMLRHNRQELAIGREIAKNIIVSAR